MSIRRVIIVGTSLAVAIAMCVITFTLSKVSIVALQESSQRGFYQTINTISHSIATSVRFKKADAVEGKLVPFLEENRVALRSVNVYLSDGEFLYGVGEKENSAFPLAAVPSTLSDSQVLLVNSKKLELLTPLFAGKDASLVGFLWTQWSFSEVEKVSNRMFKFAMLVGIIILLLTLLSNYLLVHRLLTRPLRNFTDMTEKLASGDCNLSQRINYDSSNELGILARHINTFITTLEESMNTIFETSAQVSSISNKLGSNISDLETKIRHQREDIKHSVSIGETLKESVDFVKDKIEHSSNSLKDAVGTAVTGQDKLDQAVVLNKDLASQTQKGFEVASSLSQQTQKVTTILEIIRSIAEQTNLLALNAAIEAARAGESGRGFAVVADEVRSLAEKTSSSTDQVEEILVHLKRYSDQLVETMEQGLGNSKRCVDNLEITSQQIHEIINAVNYSNTMNSTVMETSVEQFHSMSSLIDQLRQLDEQVDNLFKDSKDITAHSKDLLDGATMTQSKLKAFNLG